MQTHDTDQLFLQIRTAHRLLAAYYQRLLPTIEQIAKGVALDFYAWAPKDFARPGQRSTNPFDRWSWDLLPALSTHYVFGGFNDANKVEIGEYLVDFTVESDTGVINNSSIEPDGLTLPINVNDAKSLLSINVYVPYQAGPMNWYENIWFACESAKISEEPLPQTDPYVKLVSSGFRVPLDELFLEGSVDVLVKRTQAFIGAAVDKAKSLAEECQQENS